MDFVTVAFIGGAFFVLVLAAYALYLALRLRRQQIQVDSAQEALAEQLQGKNTEARQSIQIIARALLQKDLTDKRFINSNQTKKSPLWWLFYLVIFT